MNDSMTGSIVLVSALLPSKALTMSGNPSWSVSGPMVICGSSRRSLENPLSRNPSPVGTAPGPPGRLTWRCGWELFRCDRAGPVISRGPRDQLGRLKSYR